MGSFPINAGPRIVLTFSTAFKTPVSVSQQNLSDEHKEYLLTISSSCPLRMFVTYLFPTILIGRCHAVPKPHRSLPEEEEKIRLLQLKQLKRN